MQFRGWLTFSIVIAVAQGVLALLAILQYNAIFSDLLRQRISVIAQTTANSFKPIVNLGLPMSMMRNGDAIVARALEMDLEIRAVHAFNPSGIIIYTTLKPRPQSVPREVLRTMQLSDEIKWSVETDENLFSGFDVVGRDGVASGAVMVSYPKDRLETASRAVTTTTLQTAFFIWAAFSVLSYLLLRLLLAAPQRAIAGLETISRGDKGGGTATTKENIPPSVRSSKGLFGPAIERLYTNLGEAGRRFEEAKDALSAFTVGGRDAEPHLAEKADNSTKQPDESQIGSSSPRSLARQVASRLAPLAAFFIISSAVILGATILRNVNRSIEPELAARTNLVGTVVSDNVQRALGAGVPLDNLVGAESYFGDMLKQLPEVAYVAVATGRIVLEAGERIDPYLAPPRERKDVRSHPIMKNGKEIAYVVIDIDPGFISKKFLDVFLDMSVVILVTVLIAFEIMVLLTSRSLTAALNRLQRLAAMQAVGDFSKRAAVAARSSIDRATGVLVDRAEALHKEFAVVCAQMKNSEDRKVALEGLGKRYGLSEDGPATLRFSYFTDFRLALFLFAAADQLPLSFLPLYTRAAANVWPWIGEGVLISLPLAGYLLAIVIASPFSRSLVERFGVRPLLVLAALPTLGAHIGLYFAGTAQEIILWRTVTGFGYALVTLACQDYVLDTVPREERDRSLGMFTFVLFGGVFSGTALGGVLADRLGQHNVFLLSAALIAISALLSARFIAPGIAKSDAQSGRPELKEILATLRNGRFTALVFGLAIPANVLLQAFISYLVALTLDSLGASIADIGRTLMLYFLGVIVVGPLGGRGAEAGLPVGLIALFGAVLAGASLTLVVVWSDQIAMIGAVLGAGIGHGLMRGAQVSLAMTIAETELDQLGPTVVLGALRTLERLGSVVGLLIIAVLAGYAGYATATAAVAGWSLAGAVIFALFFATKSEFMAPGVSD